MSCVEQSALLRVITVIYNWLVLGLAFNCSVLSTLFY